MKYLYIVLAALLLPSFTYAQTNHYKAQVIKSNGETLTGYIDYSGWANNPKTIKFKSSNDAAPVKFTSKDLRSFEIYDKERYCSYAGNISTDRTRTAKLSDFLDTSSRKDTVFLREIFKGGTASLFTYTDTIKKRYFLVEGTAVPVELIFRRHYSDEKTKVVVYDDYKKQLNTMASKKGLLSVDFTNMLEKASYNEGDLIKLFKIINQNDAVAAQQIQRQTSSWWYIGAGIDRTVTTFGPLGYRLLNYSSTGYSPRIHGGFETAINPNVQRWIFRAELALSYTKPRFNIPPSQGIVNVDGFDQYMATVTPSLIWNVYNADKMKFFIGAGVSLNFTKYSNIQSKYLPEELWGNFPFTTGVVLNKKLEVALTVTPQVSSAYGVSYYQNQTSTLGIRYRLTKPGR
ncbi:MAG: hypothetical protein EOP46_08225 [Sphingobacteriaceae bacterium]|nr:MAG: hypothetical protein EOP46_08225 [Sphingobacteriaceae bacterium]